MTWITDNITIYSSVSPLTRIRYSKIKIDTLGGTQCYIEGNSTEVCSFVGWFNRLNIILFEVFIWVSCIEFQSSKIQHLKKTFNLNNIRQPNNNNSRIRFGSNKLPSKIQSSVAEYLNSILMVIELEMGGRSLMLKYSSEISHNFKVIETCLCVSSFCQINIILR